MHKGGELLWGSGGCIGGEGTAFCEEEREEETVVGEDGLEEGDHFCVCVYRWVVGWVSGLVMERKKKGGDR